jgi:hypothetical protein
MHLPDLQLALLRSFGGSARLSLPKGAVVLYVRQFYCCKLIAATELGYLPYKILIDHYDVWSLSVPVFTCPFDGWVAPDFVRISLHDYELA